MAARHTKEQREFIVRRLAAFETPADVREAFAQRWHDTTCTDDDVHACDPAYVMLPPDLAEIFRKERERILLDPASAPFVERQARLIVLSRQAKRYGENNQLAEQRAVFRQIVEELGGIGADAVPARSEPVTEIRRVIVHPS